MAIMYPTTTLIPSKLELIASWLPSQPWFSGDAAALKPLGAYRFDDPAGEVGLESHLLTAGDETVYHVPLSYRAAPLADSVEGGDAYLLGTSEHGVLGTRWFSDAAGDPVYRAVLAETIAHGGHEAPEFNQDASTGELSERPVRTLVRGSGRPEASVPDLSSATVTTGGSVTRATAGDDALEILRVIDLAGVPEEAAEPGSEFLSASWAGRDWPSIVAILRLTGRAGS